MNLQPLGTKVLVKKQIISQEPIMENGIFVMNKSGRDDRYDVVAIGPKCELPILPGDVVFISPTAPGEVITVERVPFKFIEESLIFGKEEE